MGKEEMTVFELRRKVVSQPTSRQAPEQEQEQEQPNGLDSTIC